RPAGHELDALRPLVGDDVDEKAHVAEEIRELGHLGRQAAEDESSVARHLRERDEVVILGVEGEGIAAGLAVLDVDVPPRRVVRPAVVGTDMVFRAPLLGRAQQSALVAADVDERGKRPLRVAGDEHRRAPDVTRDEVVGLCDLRLEREEIPGALEDEFLLELEQLRGRVHVAMHAENTLRGTIVDVQADVLQVHEIPSRSTVCHFFRFVRWRPHAFSLAFILRLKGLREITTTSFGHSCRTLHMRGAGSWTVRAGLITTLTTGSGKRTASPLEGRG